MVDVNGTLYPAVYGMLQPDEQFLLQTRPGQRIGFGLALPVKLVGSGPYTVSLNILTRDKTAYYDTAPPPNLSALSQHSGTTRFSIDTINQLPVHKHSDSTPVSLAANTESLIVTGWAIDMQADSPASAVYVDIDGTLYPTLYGNDRQDVAEFLQNPAYTPCGFLAHIPISTVGPGQHTLSLKIVASDGKTWYGSDSSLPVHVGSPTEPTEPTTLPAQPPDLSSLNLRSHSTRFSIDTINQETVYNRDENTPLRIPTDTRVLTISGWAVDIPADSPASAVYVDIDGTLYPTQYGSNRQDVADFLEDRAYTPCGFHTEIPISAVGPGQHTLSLKIVASDGSGYYAPERQVSFIITANK